MKHAMATTVDASGIDIYHLIASLWTDQKKAGFFDLAPQYAPPIPTREEVENALKTGIPKNYIDYINGRAIKCYFANMSRLDPTLYDKQAGQGAFKAVVDSLRRSNALVKQ